MELIMRDFKSKVIENHKKIELSFTLEDNGPGIPWPAGQQATLRITEVKNIQGQLLVKGVILPPDALKVAPPAPPAPPAAPKK